MTYNIVICLFMITTALSLMNAFQVFKNIRHLRGATSKLAKALRKENIGFFLLEIFSSLMYFVLIISITNHDLSRESALVFLGILMAIKSLARLITSKNVQNFRRELKKIESEE